MEFSSLSDKKQIGEKKAIQTSQTDYFEDLGKTEEDVAASPTPTQSQNGDEFKTKGNIVKDSKYAWLVCFASFTIQVVIVGVLHCFGVFFVAFIDEFKAAKSTAAWAGSLAYGITMLLGPMATAVILKIGVRWSIVIGSLLCALSMLISSAMTSMTWLYLSFSFLYGVGCCLAYSPTMTIAEDYFSKYLSVATGITVSGSSFGTLIMNPVAQTMVEAIGWRATFRVLAGFCSIGALCGLVFEGKTPDPTPGGMIKKSPLRRLVADLHLWKNKVYIVWVIGLTFVMFGYYIPYVHLVSHAIELGIPASQGSLIIMILGASTAGGRILFGKIITFGVLDRLHMHQLSIVITGMACMLLPLIKTLGGLLAYVVCVGLVDGCFVVMLPLLTVTLAGAENKVNAWGYVVCCTGVTFTLGPPVAGWIYDASGSYDLAFHIAGIPILLGAAVLFLIPWAQRTGNKMNDALSTAGDVDYATASQSMYSDAQSVIIPDNLSQISRLSGCDSGMSMWAAPPYRQPSLRGSVRSSFRGSTFSMDQRGPLGSIREGGGGGQGRGGLTPNMESQATSPPPDSHAMPAGGSKGWRTRSLSESSSGRDQRGVQWVDQVDYPKKVRPGMASDPMASQVCDHRAMVPQRDSITKSDQDMFLNMTQATVEVRDDLMGIFMETFVGRQQPPPPPLASVHTSNTSTTPNIVTHVSFNDGSRPLSPIPSPQSSQRSNDTSGVWISGRTSPISITLNNHRSPPRSPSTQMWNSPITSPGNAAMNFGNSPPTSEVTSTNPFVESSNSSSVNAPPELGSPKLSGQLLTIPEGERIPDNVQEIEAMLQNTNQPQQAQPKVWQNGAMANQASCVNDLEETSNSIAPPSPDTTTHPFEMYEMSDEKAIVNPFLQNKSDSSISNQTTSSVSLNQSPVSSNALVSPDAQVIFPMDSMSTEKSNVERPGQDKPPES